MRLEKYGQRLRLVREWLILGLAAQIVSKVLLFFLLFLPLAASFTQLLPAVPCPLVLQPRPRSFGWVLHHVTTGGGNCTVPVNWKGGGLRQQHVADGKL